MTVAQRLPFAERNLRRLRVYSGRSRASLPGMAPRNNCLFMHMPKCGGTSVAEAMYATIPIGNGLSVIDAVSTRRAAAMLAFGKDDPILCHEDMPDGQRTFDLREAMMLQQMAWGSRLIHGHVLYSEQAETHFGNQYHYVTLLRDPVERMISNYRMARIPLGLPSDIDEYLETAVAHSHAQVYLRYLGGRTVVAPADVSATLELAHERLARFAVVGFLDDLPDFQRRYRANFGVALRINAYNRAQGSALAITPAQTDRIATLCAPDIAIYNRAREVAAKVGT